MEFFRNTLKLSLSLKELLIIFTLIELMSPKLPVQMILEIICHDIVIIDEARHNPIEDSEDEKFG